MTGYRFTALACLFVLAITMLAAGCHDRPAPHAEPPVIAGNIPSTERSEPTSSKAPQFVPDSSARDTVWFARQRPLDIDGDGVVDTLWLRASGRHSDQLHIRLTMRRAGRDVLVDEWGADYELIDPPESVRNSEAARDTFLVARLLEVLAGAHVAPIDTSDTGENYEDTSACHAEYLTCAVRGQLWETTARSMTTDQDSVQTLIQEFRAFGRDTAEAHAVADDIRQHTRYQLEVNYGYETSLALAFSARLGRFIVLAACC